ncbi:hypothetical protein KHA80_03065 [Anaerobacillus sp. HL2]|nr:hypothetical protein KHA80_03065 [Anaerobacillus sp. HL2]
MLPTRCQCCRVVLPVLPWCCRPWQRLKPLARMIEQGVANVAVISIIGNKYK